MAGYMTKLQGYVYEGELVNGAAAPVENGLLMVQGTSTNKGKLVFGSADTTTKLLLKEVTTIFGVPAYRFVVNKLNANYYFVENGFDVNDSEAYDETLYAVPVGKYLRAHPLVVGDEFVTTKITGTLTAGTEYGVKADGTVG
jgi:hypothetical protein